jgi:hypothetical protein
VNTLTLSKKISIAFVVALVIILLQPLISIALTHLGGLTTEPLIGESGIADNALLITAGTDTMLVLSTTYETPPEAEIAWDYLDYIISIAVAVMVVLTIFKTTRVKNDIFSSKGLLVFGSLKEKNLIMTLAGVVTFAIVIVILRSF